MKDKNILEHTLIELKIKHTKSYVYKLFNEHPHKYNLYGLSTMLNDFGIKNAGVAIANKINDIGDIRTPFIALSNGFFILVYKVSDNSVSYKFRDLDLTLSKKEFCETWSGIILLCEPSANAIEPHYKENKKREFYDNVIITSLIVTISLLLIIGLIKNDSINIKLIVSFIINLMGLFIGFLLIQKRLNVSSRYSDKICSLFKKADCNNILESDAAKLWGIFGWSEIGFSYFLTNILIICFIPSIIKYYALINIFTLPYTVWSFWYQGIKAKQWCSLCVIVQLILLSIFFINLIFNYTDIYGVFANLLNIDTILALGIYLAPIILIALIVEGLSKSEMVMDITQEIKSLKSNEEIFTLLLKKQPFYNCSLSSSNIIFGNRNAPLLLTILTNPHCNPCSKLHKNIEFLLKKNENICIQYLFTSFDKSLDSSNKFLIAIYFQCKLKMKEIFNEWYSLGRFNRDSFFKKFDIETETSEVNSEFILHEKWKNLSSIRETPTILVNGYKLPPNYNLEDLLFIKNIKD